MAVSTDTTEVEYVSDGSSLGPFAIPFQCLDDSHLVVTYGPTGVENSLSLGTHYTVTLGSPLPATGNLNFVGSNPVPNTQIIRIARQTPIIQSEDLSTALAYDPATLELALDRGALIDQEIRDGNAASPAVHGNQGGGAQHTDVVRGGASGFMNGTVLDGILDHTETLGTGTVTGDNPHGLAPADIGAAAAAHVGAGGTGVHALATATLDGFMKKEHFAIVDALPAASNPMNVIVEDHFRGSALSSAAWTRTTSGTAPTASFPSGFEFGVYRETTAAAATSVALKRSGAKAKVTRSPTWYGNYGFGAAGPSYINILALLGLAEDPSTLTQNYAFFRVNPAGNVEAVSRGTSSEQTSSLGALASLFGGAPADTAIHAFKIEVISGSVKFYIQGALVATHTLQVPQSTALLEAFDQVSNSGGSVAQSMDVDYVRVDAVVAYP